MLLRGVLTRRGVTRVDIHQQNDPQTAWPGAASSGLEALPRIEVREAGGAVQVYAPLADR